MISYMSGSLPLGIHLSLCLSYYYGQDGTSRPRKAAFNHRVVVTQVHDAHTHQLLVCLLYFFLGGISLDA